MTRKKFTPRFSEETRLLKANKTNLLFYARERAAANDPVESAHAFAKAGRLEEDIAVRLEAEGFPLEAMIGWVSAASCYHLAHNLVEALRVCELVQEKPFFERCRDVFQQIQTDCEKAIVNPFRTIGAGEPPPDSLYPKPAL